MNKKTAFVIHPFTRFALFVLTILLIGQALHPETGTVLHHLSSFTAGLCGYVFVWSTDEAIEVKIAELITRLK